MIKLHIHKNLPFIPMHMQCILGVESTFMRAHWRRDSFLVPSGKVGKDFVIELARLCQAYADNTTLHSVSLTTCCVFQTLLLQKPHARSKSAQGSCALFGTSS